MAWISREEVRRRCLCELCSRRPVVDLELTLALPSPAQAPPQACNVVACDCQLYFFAGAGAGRQGVAAADDGHAISLEGGHTGDNNPEPWPLMMVNAENRLNEVVPAAMTGAIGGLEQRPRQGEASADADAGGRFPVQPLEREGVAMRETYAGHLLPLRASPQQGPRSDRPKPRGLIDNSMVKLAVDSRGFFS